ncbi:MAG: DUF2017 family protein [Micrococcaceae bacterium]
MATAFYHGVNGYTSRLNSAEKRMLRGLFSDVIELLEEDEHDDELEKMAGLSSGERPEDPALLKLLPDGVVEQNQEEAQEFRRLSESNVRQRKIEQLRHSIQQLGFKGSTSLNPTQAIEFAAALNSVRTVLAARLEIEDDADSERILDKTDFTQVETPEEYMAVTYNFVSWLQDTLMQAMLAFSLSDDINPLEGE